MLRLSTTRAASVATRVHAATLVRAAVASAAPALTCPFASSTPARCLHVSLSLLREQFNRDKENMKRKREKAIEQKKREKGKGAGQSDQLADSVGVSVPAMEERMQEYVENMRTAFASIKAGRVMPSLLDDLPVQAHGQSVPLRALAAVSARNAQTLVVQLYDPSLMKDVDRAIRSHNSTLNPSPDTSSPGALVVTYPKMTKDARNDLAKQVAKRADETKGHVRDIRQKWLTQVRSLEKKGDCPEDLAKDLRNQIQVATDAVNTEIKKMQDEKEKEIREV